MKKALIMLVLMLYSTASMFAQFVGGESQKSYSLPSVSSTSNEDLDFIFTTLSYSPVKLKSSYSSNDEDSFNGISLGAIRNNAIGASRSFYEFGTVLQYAFDSKKVGSIKSYTDFLTVIIPVGLGYSIQIPNTNLFFEPIAGFDFDIHILGNSRTTYDSRSETIDLFKKEDVGVKYNRFNIDWHAGARFRVNKFFVGAKYRSSILGLYKEDDYKLTFSQVDICIGLDF